MLEFDQEISKLAKRVLINTRKIDYHTGVSTTKITPARDGKPVTIELTDAKTKEPKETLEVDAALIATGRAPYTQDLGLENINVVTQRGYVPVDERMRVVDANGKLVPNLYCIGDANGKMMLAHAASAQGIPVVEQVTGRDHILNHLSIPAACFTYPEISMVGFTEVTNMVNNLNKGRSSCSKFHRDWLNTGCIIIAFPHQSQHHCSSHDKADLKLIILIRVYCM